MPRSTGLNVGDCLMTTRPLYPKQLFFQSAWRIPLNENYAVQTCIKELIISQKFLWVNKSKIFMYIFIHKVCISAQFRMAAFLISTILFVIIYATYINIYYTYIHIHIYIYIYIYIYIHIHTYTHIYIYIHIYIYTYIYLYLYIYIYIHIFTPTYINIYHIYIYMCVCVYMYIYKLLCHLQKCQYICIHISKIRHFFLNELYFGFFKTLEDSIK